MVWLIYQNIDIFYRPTDDSNPLSTDFYIKWKKFAENFMHPFNYKAFQYVEVTSSYPVELSLNSLRYLFYARYDPPAGQVNSYYTSINKIW